MKKALLILILFIFQISISYSQSYERIYGDFKLNIQERYQDFREECNKKYVEFIKNSWKWYEGKAAMPLPKELTPIPPRPFRENNRGGLTENNPVVIDQIAPNPQPKPITPIKEIDIPEEGSFTFNFYGQRCSVRLPEFANLSLKDCQPNSIADGWQTLCNNGMNNAIRDCLETRIRYNLCDWAYLIFLNQLAQQYCGSPNGATLLAAFLYCQSGYQMRLAVDGSKLIMLYGSKHQIFDKGYFNIDGVCFYPFGEVSNSISICDAAFEGESPLSLIIDKEQLLGVDMSEERIITSEHYNMSTVSCVPQKLIEFYNTYPTSALDGNPMTRWAMYANTPLAKKTKDKLYPTLRKYIAEMNKLQAAEMLLNWVQTGFVYEYDDKIWGQDRAFFAEETLFYPYCDCEDRSILFSRLIRDLLDLDVALVYYPGHLATAVYFDEEVKGDAMIINNRKFIVCDPTYIGASVGAHMPDLEYDKTQCIVLKR